MKRKPRFTITMDTTPSDLYTESIKNTKRERERNSMRGRFKEKGYMNGKGIVDCREMLTV